MVSESGDRLHKAISKAIDDHIITPEEYDEIIEISMEDGYIDAHERALLAELQQMIANKEIKFTRFDKK